MIYILMSWLWICQSAFAEPNSEVHEALLTLLQLRNPTQLPALVRRLGPTVPDEIQKLYDSETVFHKIRLLNILSYFKDQSTIELLKKEATTNSNPYIQEAALQSLSFSQGSSAEKFISGFLTHSNSIVRDGATKALTRLKSSTSIVQGSDEAFLTQSVQDSTRPHLLRRTKSNF